MKGLLYFLGGFGIVAAYLVTRHQQTSSAAKPVEELAHRLQDAWADHHTVA